MHLSDESEKVVMNDIDRAQSETALLCTTSSDRNSNEPSSQSPTLESLLDATKSIADGIAQLRADRIVLNDLHTQCRAHAEQDQWNNVVRPIVLGLIGLADRCRQGNADLRAKIRRANDTQCKKLLSQIIDVRHVDRLEIEELLNRLGVESFRALSERFDPALHKCIDRTHTSVQSLHLTLAHRYLPGYRRGELVVRPEYVGVFVFSPIPLSPISRS